jgi:preprotein translocase subunit SecD
MSQMGTGTIQGFAVALAVGVVSSVFTALFVSRLIFDFSTDVLHSQKVSVSWRTKMTLANTLGGKSMHTPVEG